jgi:dTMP kinase
VAPGRFITFEGGEGAGKSTQVRRLADALKGVGVPVCVTREPGGTPGGEEIRQLLVRGAAARWDATTEALLHYAARRDHLQALILPSLAAGTWVLSDRFADSTMAYQGYGHQLGRAPVEQLYALVVGGFRPDLTVILEVPVDDGLRRAAGRRDGETRYEGMDRAFHERVRDGFRDIARREPKRCHIVDGAASIEDVHAEIRHLVGKHLGIDL